MNVELWRPFTDDQIFGKFDVKLQHSKNISENIACIILVHNLFLAANVCK